MELWKQQITSYVGQSKYQHLATLFSKYIVYQSFEGSALEDINAIPPHHFPQLLAAQTYTFKWWMGHYNASSPKPQRGWCNNKAFANLDKGPYRRSVQPKLKFRLCARRSVKMVKCPMWEQQHSKSHRPVLICQIDFVFIRCCNIELSCNYCML